MSLNHLRWAEQQVNDVQQASNGTLSIVEVLRSSDGPYPLIFDLSFSTKHLHIGREGLVLRQRERINIAIPQEFPFQLPSAYFSHTRFAGVPHVHWSRSLCLYQSPSTEWNPEDGLFGFLERIEEWLRDVSAGTINSPDVGAVHPPTAYASVKLATTCVLIVQDTPKVKGLPWLGKTRIKQRNSKRADIVGWSSPEDNKCDSDEIWGAAILLQKEMPYEYPLSFSDLLVCLKQHGLSTRQVLDNLASAALMNNVNYPLYVAIGAPMRRMPEELIERQHLAVWFLNLGIVNIVRQYSSLAVEGNSEKIARFIHQCETAHSIPIEWCRVLEGRTEVTLRRDMGRPLSWFEKKSVQVLGAGALGSLVCEMLVRAGVSTINICDNKLVGPGVLVRQPYTSSDVGTSKVAALKQRLDKIAPGIKVTTSVSDILTRPSDGSSWGADLDLIIDTTANVSVSAKLESLRRENVSLPRIPIISMAVDSEANRGLLLVSGSRFSGSVLDVGRKAKLVAFRNQELTDFRNAFWREGGAKIFQPEPGCSDATYVGSYADVLTFAGMMLNLAARDLATSEEINSSAHFVAQPWIEPSCSPTGKSWTTDYVIQGSEDQYEFRFEQSALDSLRDLVDQNARSSNSRNETGGVLFGEVSISTRIVWITEIIKAPSDSSATPVEFVCGVEGIQEINTAKINDSGGSNHFVGFWHTHPSASAIPSSVDMLSAVNLLAEPDINFSKLAMVIVGGSCNDYELGCGLFEKHGSMVQWSRTRWN